MDEAGQACAETDEALMAKSANGDRVAFGRLAARQLPRLTALAVRVLDNRAEAEEVAQEALLRAWRHAAAYSPDRAKVTTWLHRITLNLALDRRRAARPHAPMTLADELPDDRPAITALIEQAQRAKALAEGIAALPARQRQAVQLTYAEQLAGAEAASLMGISARALEGLLRRGRHFLRDWLLTRDV